MKSKYIIRLTTLLLCYVFILTSCNDEWKEEQYKQYISFRAPLGELGVTDVYIPYSRRNPDKTFVKGSGLSSYQLPIIVSGSTTNDKDITVHIAHDSDTLKVLNEACSEILRLLLPLRTACIGITRVEDLRIDARQFCRHLEVEIRNLLRRCAVDRTVLNGVNDAARILNGDALPRTIPARIHEIGA